MKYLDELIKIYQESKICMFMGAGVSFTASPTYKTPGWWGLLHTIYKEGKRISNSKKWERFEQLKNQFKDPWDFVDNLITLVGSEQEFENLLVKSLIKKTGRDKRYKRLPIGYLKQAETLQAVLSFCSEIKYIKKYPCFKSNDKIKSILTLNYDWYLEGGATQKYNSSPFKPMVDEQSEVKPNKLPIYHLHGYIPFNINVKRRRALIMSTKSYQNIYKNEKTWTKTVLSMFLPHYMTIFIGVSFDDLLLLSYLQDLSRSFEYPHFFFARKRDFEEEKVFKLKNAKINPIWISNFGEIPMILKKIYKSGLTKNKRTIEYRLTGTFEELTENEYWSKITLIKK